MMLSSYLKPDLFLDNKFHLISIISYAGDNNEWNGLCHFRCASFLLCYMIHYNMRKVPQKVIYTEWHNSLFLLHWTRYLLFLVITWHQKWFEVHSIKLYQSWKEFRTKVLLVSYISNHILLFNRFIYHIFWCQNILITTPTFLRN